MTQWLQENDGISNPFVVIKYIYVLRNYFSVRRLDYFYSLQHLHTEKQLQTEAASSILLRRSTGHTAIEYIFQVGRG